MKMSMIREQLKSKNRNIFSLSSEMEILKNCSPLISYSKKDSSNGKDLDYLNDYIPNDCINHEIQMPLKEILIVLVSKNPKEKSK